MRLLYDHLPTHLLFLPVTERRLGGSIEHLTRSLSHELMLASQRWNTSRRQQSSDAGGLMTDEIPLAQLQASTDCHALKLVDLLL